MMTALDALRNIRFVVDADGKEAAVQVSMEDWKALLGYLEDLEDREAVKKELARLKQGPEKSGALLWQDVRDQW